MEAPVVQGVWVQNFPKKRALMVIAVLICHGPCRTLEIAGILTKWLFINYNNYMEVILWFKLKSKYSSHSALRVNDWSHDLSLLVSGSNLLLKSSVQISKPDSWIQCFISMINMECTRTLQNIHVPSVSL